MLSAFCCNELISRLCNSITNTVYVCNKWFAIKPLNPILGIPTHYGLDGPGIESRRGRDFLHLTRLAVRPTQPPLQWVPGFPGVKWPGRGVDHPPHLAPRLRKEKSYTSTPSLGLCGLL